MRVATLVLIGMLLLALLSACTGTTAGTEFPSAPATSDLMSTEEPSEAEATWHMQQVEGVVAPAGYEIGVIIQGLSGPTQMIEGPDGDLWIAQLGGAEGGGTGNVVAISPTGEQRILLEGLFDPTGVVVTDGYLWLAVGQDIARVPIQEDFSLGEMEMILEDLPFNQRTNGTLTLTPENKLLFITSGRPAVEAGDYSDSGILWELDPDAPTTPARPIATGLKNAYAHVYDIAGQLWVTEVSDDVVDGVAAPDEINRIVEGGDYGWPECFGNRKPALSLGGNDSLCEATIPPVVLFPPHTTPTSIVASPWEENTFIVALWLAGDVVKVTPGTTEAVVDAPMTPYIDGLRRPQHLLVGKKGDLFISDFGTGAVYLMHPAGT